MAVLVSSGNDNSCYYRLHLSCLPFYREVLCCSLDHCGLSTSNCLCFLWKQEFLIDGKLSAMSRKGFVLLKKKKIPTFIFRVFSIMYSSIGKHWFISVPQLGFLTGIYLENQSQIDLDWEVSWLQLGNVSWAASLWIFLEKMCFKYFFLNTKETWLVFRYYYLHMFILGRVSQRGLKYIWKSQARLWVYI